MKYIKLFIIYFTFNALANAQQTELEVVTEHWPPYIIQGTEVTGIVTEKINQILQPTDINYTIHVYPWARSYHLATTKPNVLIYSIYRNEQREPYFHWFCPIHDSTPIYVFTLAHNDKNIDSIEALKSSVIGIMRGDNSHNFFKKYGFKEQVNLDVSADEDANLLKLVNGKIDAVVQSRDAIEYRLKKLGMNGIKIKSGLAIHQGDHAQHCMALSKGTDQQLVDKVQAAFERWLLTK